MEAAHTGAWAKLRRWSRREPELAFRLLALGAVTLLTQFNYLAHVPADREVELHVRVTVTEVLWMVAVVCLQWLARRSDRPDRLWPFWVAVDVSALTAILQLLHASHSVLIVGYPLLVVASGLWSRAWLVWLTVGLSMFGYALIWATTVIQTGDLGNYYLDIVIVSLIVTGVIVSHQVQRFWVMSRYYDRRPGRP